MNEEGTSVSSTSRATIEETSVQRRHASPNSVSELISPYKNRVQLRILVGSLKAFLLGEGDGGKDLGKSLARPTGTSLPDDNYEKSVLEDLATQKGKEPGS